MTHPAHGCSYAKGSNLVLEIHLEVCKQGAENFYVDIPNSLQFYVTLLS
jgi:hypothetical protein